MLFMTHQQYRMDDWAGYLGLVVHVVSSCKERHSWDIDIPPEVRMSKGFKNTPSRYYRYAEDELLAAELVSTVRTETETKAGMSVDNRYLECAKCSKSERR